METRRTVAWQFHRDVRLALQRAHTNALAGGIQETVQIHDIAKAQFCEGLGCWRGAQADFGIDAATELLIVIPRIVIKRPFPLKCSRPQIICIARHRVTPRVTN